jgi:hypothetical protein
MSPTTQRAQANPAWWQVRAEHLKKRVLGLLSDPIHEWRTIAAEPEEVASLYTYYIMPLAAIPLVTTFIGLAIIGDPLAGRFGLLRALASAIGLYLSQLIAPMVGAIVVEQLAPRFNSRGTRVDALKLVAYASTPMWVAGVLYLLLYLAPLVLAGAVYSIYLLYLGLPSMMKTHPDNLVRYTLVTVIALVVLNIVLSGLRVTLGLLSYGL